MLLRKSESGVSVDHELSADQAGATFLIRPSRLFSL